MICADDIMRGKPENAVIARLADLSVESAGDEIQISFPAPV
jgi:hypothetical protein